MRYSENARNLVCLLQEVEQRQKSLLCFYVLSNLIYRITKGQLFKSAAFKFSFGTFHVLLSRGDLGTIGEIFVQKPYQKISEFIPKEGDVCIDVGANIGCVSLQWRVTNKSGVIIAVEPHPITFKRMVVNYKLNDIKEIDSVQSAIGSQNGFVDIVMDNDNNSMARVVGDHLQYIDSFKTQTTSPVPCITIDKLVSDKNIKKINILKLDVEGFEVECLRGAGKALQITDKVMLEFHSEELRKSCEEILGHAGFQLKVIGSILFAYKYNELDRNQINSPLII